MKKFVVAPALAALAMFVFGAIYWMSPFPYKALTPVGDNAAAAAALGKIFPATGTYLVPGPETDEKQVEQLFAQGPSAMVHFVKEGHPMMEPAVFAQGFAHYFVTALLLMIMLTQATPLFHSFMCRVKFSVFIGVLAAVAVTFSNPIWWHHTWGWALMGTLYCVLNFAVAGLVLAKFTMTPVAK
jgi:hypothetical protein